MMNRRLRQLLCSALATAVGVVGLSIPAASAGAEPKADDAPIDTTAGAAASTPHKVNLRARPVSSKTAKRALGKASSPAALKLPATTAGKFVQVASATALGEVSVAGAVWDGGQEDATVYLRTVTAGRTSAWQEVESEGSTEGLNGTAGVALVGADTVQVAAVSSRNLNVTLSVVDPQAQLSPQTTGVPEPGNTVVRTRADWGADETLVRATPVIAEVKGVVVHHTEGSNSYTQAQVPAIIRGIYAYHVVTRGWNDIGYNVLVDKFGVAWEGRRGGLEKAVQGAHAYNWNHVSFGISLMGSHLTAIPSPAALETLARVIAWKFVVHGVQADSTYSNAGGKYPAIVGHKDVQDTDCPGTYLYPQLGSIRSRVATLIGGYSPAVPVSVSAVSAGSKPVGQVSYVWGAAVGAAGSRVAVEVLVGDRWSVSQIGVVGANGSYTLPLTYGMHTAGTNKFRVTATTSWGAVSSKEFTFIRTPVVSVASAGTKPVGQTTYAWGYATGAHGARVTVQALVAGRWSVSQAGIVRADGSYTLPLTYGWTTAGAYTFRVEVTTSGGTYPSPEFRFTRTPVVSAVSARSKPVGQASYVWGSALGAGGARIAVQALVGAQWSDTQAGTVRTDASYTLPLTYGWKTAGTYTFRVTVTTTGGAFSSPEFNFTRT